MNQHSGDRNGPSTFPSKAQSLKMGRRSRQSYGSRGASEKNQSGDPGEWLQELEETMSPLPNFDRNRTKSFKYPGANFPEKRLPFLADSRTASCSQQGVRKFSTYNADVWRKSSFSFRGHFVQPPSSKDRCVLVSSPTAKGISRGRNETFSYADSSPDIENDLMFREGGNRRRRFSKMPGVSSGTAWVRKSPQWEDGMQPCGIIIFRRKKASQLASQQTPNLMGETSSFCHPAHLASLRTETASVVNDASIPRQRYSRLASCTSIRSKEPGNVFAPVAFKNEQTRASCDSIVLPFADEMEVSKPPRATPRKKASQNVRQRNTDLLENNYALYEKQKNLNLPSCEDISPNQSQWNQAEQGSIDPCYTPENSQMHYGRRKRLLTYSSSLPESPKDPLVYIPDEVKPKHFTYSRESHSQENGIEEFGMHFSEEKRGSQNQAASRFTFCEDSENVKLRSHKKSRQSCRCHPRILETIGPSPPNEDSQSHNRRYTTSCAPFSSEVNNDYLGAIAYKREQIVVACRSNLPAEQSTIKETGIQCNGKKKASKHNPQRMSQIMESSYAFREAEENKNDEGNERKTNHNEEDQISIPYGIGASSDIKPMEESATEEPVESIRGESSSDKEVQESFESEKEGRPTRQRTNENDNDKKMSSHCGSPFRSQTTTYHNHDSVTSRKSELPAVEEPLVTKFDAASISSTLEGFSESPASNR